MALVTCPRKTIIEKSEGDRAQIVGFLIIFASIAMFALVALLGFISILMSLGPGLGFSGGTCSNTCESMWSGAVLSKWISLLLFPCGLIALARPWSWFRTDENIRHNSALKVISVIASVIALIVVISFGGACSDCFAYCRNGDACLTMEWKIWN